MWLDVGYAVFAVIFAESVLVPPVAGFVVLVGALEVVSVVVSPIAVVLIVDWSPSITLIELLWSSIVDAVVETVSSFVKIFKDKQKWLSLCQRFVRLL